MVLFFLVSVLCIQAFRDNGIAAKEEKYLYLDEENVCMLNDEDCDPSKYAEYFVAGHNLNRAVIVSTRILDLRASNMLKMVWDQSLADIAQKAAEQCIDDYPPFVEDPVTCRNPDSFTGGVNFFRNQSKRLEDIKTRIYNVLTEWAKYLIQKKDFSSIRFFKASGRAEETWANIVQATTWRIGCGIADGYGTDYRKTPYYAEVICCLYGNKKLQNGDEMYKVGTPCSQCPREITHCTDLSDSDPLLCAVDVDKCPIPSNQYDPTCAKNEETNRKILWKCDLKKYGAECGTMHSCYRSWTVEPSGNYKWIPVTGDCVSANVFAKKVRIDGTSCFSFLYFKNSSNYEPTATMVAGMVFNLDSGEIIQEAKYKNENSWTEIMVDIPWAGVDIKVGVLVRSFDDNTGIQQISVKKFHVNRGPCQRTTDRLELPPLQ